MSGMKNGMLMAAVMGIVGVWARPGGAPGCNVNAVQMMSGGNLNSQELGFSMSIEPQTYSPDGGEFTITMSGPTMKGLLMYLTSANDDTMRIGEFVDFNEANWKSNSENCQNGLQCPSNACALTHSNPDDKDPPQLKLTYPAGGDMGPLILRASVVTTGDGQTYQVLPDLMINPDGGVGGGNLEDIAQTPIAPPPIGGGNCNCEPVKRCKKWKGQAPPSGGAPPYVPGASPIPIGGEY